MGGDWQQLLQSVFIGLIFSFLLAKLISLITAFKDDNLSLTRACDTPTTTAAATRSRHHRRKSSNQSELESMVSDGLRQSKSIGELSEGGSRVSDDNSVAAEKGSVSGGDFVLDDVGTDDDDDWEGVESTELDEAFSAATAFVAATVADKSSQKVPNEVQLQLYGLYKIATEGPCGVAPPPAFKIRARAKVMSVMNDMLAVRLEFEGRNAWQKLGAMPPEDAMQKYVEIVTELFPSLARGGDDKTKGGDHSSESKGPMGPVFSTFIHEEESGNELKMDAIHDFAREGDLDNLLKCIENGVSVDLKGVVNLKLTPFSADSEGRTPLHWAVDRGHSGVIELLCSKGADMNAKDHEGQTPLHYAVVCDREAIAEYLVKHNADVDVKDNDDTSPSELCEKNWPFMQAKDKVTERCGWSMQRGIIREMPPLPLIDGGDDGVADGLNFLELLFVVFLLSALVVVQPLHGLLHSSLDLLLLIRFKLVRQLVFVTDLVLHVVDVSLQAVPGIDPLLHLLVFLSKLLGFLHHSLDLFLAKTALVVGDGDLFGFSGGLVFCPYVKLPEKPAVLGQTPFTFKDLILISIGNPLHHDWQKLYLDGDSGLLVLCSSGSTWSSPHRQSQYQDSTISNSFIGVNTLVGLLAVEVLLQELLDLGNPSTSTNKNNLINLALLQASILHRLLDGAHGLPKEIVVQFLKTCPVGVSIGGKDFKNTIVNCQDTDIECPTTKVKDKDVLFTALLVQAVGNGCRSWFINNSSNIQTSNDSRILGSLPLGIIEIRDVSEIEDPDLPQRMIPKIIADARVLHAPAIVTGGSINLQIFRRAVSDFSLSSSSSGSLSFLIEGDLDNLLECIENGISVDLKVSKEAQVQDALPLRSDILFGKANTDARKMISCVVNLKLTPFSADSKGRTPLHWAVDRGHSGVIELLCSKGADMNAKDLKEDFLLGREDHEGQTPLHYAVVCDREAIAEYLVKHNADIDVKDNDDTSPSEVLRSGNTGRCLACRRCGWSMQRGIIHGGDDGVADGLNFLELLFVVFLLSALVVVQPLHGLLHSGLDLLLLVRFKLVGQLVFVTDLVLHVVDVSLQAVPGIDPLLHLLVFLSKLLGLLHHSLDLFLAQTALVVGTARLYFENKPWCWCDSSKVKLPEKPAVLGQTPFTFKDLILISIGNPLHHDRQKLYLDGDSGLLVLVSSEDLRFLVFLGINLVITPPTVSIPRVRGATSKRRISNASLDSSTISNSFVGVNTLVGLLAVEVLLQELLDLGNPSTSTNKNNLINLALLQASILHRLLDGAHGLPKEIVVQFLKTCPGSLGTLTLPPQFSKSPVVLADILVVLLLNQLNKDFKNTIVNCQDTDIECPTTKVKDKDVLFTALLVQTIGNGCRGWFINNPSNIQTSNDSCILGSLPLGIIEVSCTYCENFKQLSRIEGHAHSISQIGVRSYQEQLYFTLSNGKLDLNTISIDI
ncbi:hypothetical protein Cgig2_016003 [Carnegiea gigantea]|uniref:ACB domain-containing protein n=1 Tax=Carnegiea gigantea TaxID=171969 RepID=A0A9Q1QL01_9CARY|nr:hypothetical protein Cgig2_016003 [Carnegiea gigantea]